MDEKKLLRLPLWAREKIKDQARQIEKLEEALTAISTEIKPTSQFYNYAGSTIYIPDRTPVIFKAPDMAVSAYINFDDNIRIDLWPIHDIRCALIRPVATNVIEVVKGKY